MLPYIDENRRTKENLGYSMIPHLAEKSWLKLSGKKLNVEGCVVNISKL